MFLKQQNILAKKIISTILSVCMIFMICFSVVSPVYAAERNENKATAKINYATEQIEFGNKEDNEKQSATPKYMYSPNVSVKATPKKQTTEKWYPVYGGTIDISKYIPAASGKECFFAIRFADDVPREDGTYKSRNTIIIPGRQSTTAADLKRNISYNALTEKIEIGNFKYDYQIGLSEWNYGMTGDLNVSSKYMPLGGVVTIRQSATNENFASVSIKIKVPKAAATPNLKVNHKTEKIVGITKKSGWAASEDGIYKEFTDSSIELKLFEEKFGKADKFDTEYVQFSAKSEAVECLVIYVKTLATERVPSSQAQVLYIPLDFIEEQTAEE